MGDSRSGQANNHTSGSRKDAERDWEGAIDRQIREAMERGDFENLSGRGKPIDLGRNPYSPEEWDLAFKLLREAGFAPEWIEKGKEIREVESEISAPFQSYLNRKGETGALAASIEAELVSEFRKKGAELNRLIDNYNLIAPSPRLHHARIRIEEEIERFRTAANKRRA